MSRPFYLVQRMTAEDSGRPGFDGLLHLDYMGAAEFEFGALPKSLERIRAFRKLAIITEDLTLNGHTRKAYVVGDEKQATTMAPKLQAWVDGGCRGHEVAHFAEQIDGTADNYQRRTNAWWDIQGDVMFTLDADIAQRLVKAVMP